MSDEEIEDYIVKKFTEEINFAERLKNLAIQEKSKLTHLQEPTVIVSTLLLNSSIKTYEAMLMLAKQGFGQQVLALTRLILENSINFQYIADKPEERSKQYLEYAKKERYELIKRGKEEYGCNVISEELSEIIEDDYKNIGFDFSNGKFNRSWTGEAIKGMAKKTGFQFHYEIIYKILCYHAHPSPSGGLTSVKVYKEENKVGLVHGASEELIDFVFLFSYDPFIRIMGNYNNLHNLGFDKEVESFIGEYNKLFRNKK